MDKIKLLKNKDYSLLLFGMTSSNLGTSISSVCIIFYFLRSFSVEMSTKLIAGYWLTKLLAEIILTPYLSPLIDKLNRKNIIIACDIIRGILYICFSVVLLKIDKNIYFYIFYFVIFTISNFFQTAVFSIIPSIVDKKNLNEINSITSSSMEFSWLIGGILGGILYRYFSLSIILAFDGLSFLLSAFSEMFLDIKDDTKIIKEKLNKHLNLEFYKDVLKDKSVSYMLYFDILSGFLLSPVFRIVLPYFAINIISLNSTRFGLFDSIMTLGIALGAFFYKKNQNSIYNIISNNVFYLSIVFFSFLILTILFKSNLFVNKEIVFLISLILLMFSGVFQSNNNIEILSSYQQNIDPKHLGRFYGFRIMLLKSSMMIGIFSFSLLMKSKVEFGFLVVCIAFLILAIVYRFYFANKLRQYKNIKIPPFKYFF